MVHLSSLFPSEHASLANMRCMLGVSEDWRGPCESAFDAYVRCVRSHHGHGTVGGNVVFDFVPFGVPMVKDTPLFSEEDVGSPTGGTGGCGRGAINITMRRVAGARALKAPGHNAALLLLLLLLWFGGDVNSGASAPISVLGNGYLDSWRLTHGDGDAHVVCARKDIF